MDALEAIGGCNSGAIDDQVSYLAYKQVRRDPSCFTILVVIGTRVNKGEGSKARRGLEGGAIARVSNQLSHVIEDDWFPNKVSPRWNVHNRGCVSGGVANPWATAVAVRNGTIDSIRVIRHTVTFIYVSYF